MRRLSVITSYSIHYTKLYEITNSKRAIHTPADLEGLKIRVVGTPAFIDTMKALGVITSYSIHYTKLYDGWGTGESG